MSLPKTWTAGLNEFETDELSKQLKEADEVLLRLEKILQKKLDGEYRNQISDKAYEIASWPYKQADSVGYQRALTEIQNLIKKRN